MPRLFSQEQGSNHLLALVRGCIAGRVDLFALWRSGVAFKKTKSKSIWDLGARVHCRRNEK